MSLVLMLVFAVVAGDREMPVTPMTPIGARLRNGSISDLDYPSTLPKGFAGDSTVAILIDPTGKVVECAPSWSSGIAELDSHTCKLVMKRFRYRPYKDQSGRPIWVKDSVTVHWRPPR